MNFSLLTKALWLMVAMVVLQFGGSIASFKSYVSTGMSTTTQNTFRVALLRREEV